MTNALKHQQLAYSGKPFGDPSPAVGSKAWRLKRNFLGHQSRANAHLDAVNVELGQDAVTVQLLSGGLSFYAGYCYGTFTNMGDLRARFGGSAKLVTITPVVQGVVPAMCLDIEPGDARPADAPSFQRLSNHDGARRPIYYCSASDANTVIGALANAGYRRSDYYLWLAHWIGQHICAPSSCGYPAADGTQYASNNAFDSDLFYSYILGPAQPGSPTPVLSLTTPHMTDPINGVDAVHSCQNRLNAWATAVKSNPAVKADGDFGPVTEAAVKSFQSYVHLVATGSTDAATWKKLLAAPAVVKPPAPLSATPVATYFIDIGREIPGYTGEYVTTVGGQPPVRSTEKSLRVPVPKPGAYKVVTEAEGYEPTTRVVIVR